MAARLRLVVAPPAPLTPEEQAALHRARAALYAQLAKIGRQVVQIDERLSQSPGGGPEGSPRRAAGGR